MIFSLATLALTAGCHRPTGKCYRCIDTHQVDASVDVCENDTTAAGRNAYSTLASGGHITNTNGAEDSCIFFTR
ncbi:MAG: hypothetical protein JSS76_09415 [Bacteroidetes bacterium]|nr:hypothetical protein [Bacteroidota bacterium]